MCFNAMCCVVSPCHACSGVGARAGLVVDGSVSVARESRISRIRHKLHENYFNHVVLTPQSYVEYAIVTSVGPAMHACKASCFPAGSLGRIQLQTRN